MGGRQADFAVDTKGRCFFCLNSTNPECPIIKMEPGSPQMLSPNLFHSVHYLSRYLKINMGKVFPDTVSIPVQLLEKVLKSKLKVELCDECSIVNDQFAKVFKELERVDMEATFLLQQILTKLSVAGDKVMTEEFRTVFGDENVDNGKLIIADALRKDTLGKCSQKLQNAYPKVRIQKMARKEIGEENSKLKSISKETDNKTGAWLHSEASFEDFQPINIKMEDTNTDWLTNYSSDNGGGHMEETSLAVSEEIKYVARDMAATAPLSNRVLEMPTNSNASVTVIPPPASAREETDVPIKSICNRAKEKYKCGYCTKELSSSYSRTLHQNAIHLGAKFTCPVCRKEFNDKSVRRRHLRTTTCRTGKPPEPKVYKHNFHCKLCATGFVSKGSLQVHLNEAHLKIRNHECNICGNKFLRGWHLTNHRRKVHKLEN